MNNRYLKIITVILLFFFVAFGMVFIIKTEEDNRPKFQIQQDRNIYYTNKYTSDSSGCIYFTYIDGRKCYNMVLCGKYSIQEKIKNDAVLGQQ